MKKNEKKEKILLDARLKKRIGTVAFQACLCNGHGFTAFGRLAEKEKLSELFARGATVRVAFSPYDMSRAKVVLPKIEVEENES